MSKKYQLRLYVSGATMRSKLAIENIKTICDTYICDDYQLDIIDIYQQTDMGIDHDIIAMPTLINVSPGMLRRLVGDMSDEQLLFFLGIKINVS